MESAGTTTAVRVERCPACGARYNVTRLAAGSRFSCRRCGSAVTVLGAADAPTAAGGTRVALLVAGLVLLLGAALRSLPSVYAGEEGWSNGAAALALPDAVAFALVAATGGLALAGAAPRAGRAIHVAVAVAVVVLFLRSHGPSTPSLRAAAPDPAGAAALALVAAGALALASRSPGSRGAARPLVVVGVALIAATAAAHFAAGSGGHASGLFARLDAVRALAEAIWRGEPPAESPSPWDGALPDGLVLVATALALAAVLVPGRGGASVSRAAGRAAFLLVLLSLFVPHAVRLWAVRDRWLGEGGGALVATRVAAAIFDGGIGLWLAVAAVGATLVEPRARTPRSPARSGPAHAITAMAAVAAVALLVNPTTGTLSRTLPWTLVVDAGRTEAAVATALLGLLATVAALALLVPPLRGRGGLVAAAAAAAACASDLSTPTADIPRFAIPALLAVAAGSLLARRDAQWDGRGRGATTGAAAAILLLLLLPSATAGDGVRDGIGPYACALTSLVGAVTDAGGGPARLADLVADPSHAATAVGAAGAAAALLAGAFGPRRPLAWATAVCAAALALHGPLHALLTELSRPDSAGAATPLLAGLAAAGAALRLVPTPSIFGALAASADAAGGRPA